MPPSLTTVAAPASALDPIAHQRHRPRFGGTPPSPALVVRIPSRAGGDIHPAPPILSPALLRMKARARGPQRHHSQTARTRPPSAQRTNHLDSITSRSSTSCPLFATRLCCTTALPHEVTKPRERVRSADLQRLTRGKAPHDDTVVTSPTTGALLRRTRRRPIGRAWDADLPTATSFHTITSSPHCTRRRRVDGTTGHHPWCSSVPHAPLAPARRRIKRERP
ncbi:hypothetical protein K438DRAFT_1983526 [Mycena galopus ATCC 62051]|nr:hypothetical protein K438DRAFT_1983526 [Mycena galopus ATCC 62051]